MRDLNAVETTNYPLTLGVRPGRRLAIELGYDPALFDPATAERMAGQLTRVLAGFAAAGDRPLSDVEILSVAERHRILVEHNETAHPIRSGTVASLFAEQVRRTPDAVALVADG